MNRSPSRADTALGHVEYLDLGQGWPAPVVHGSPGGSDQGALMAESLLRAGLRAIVPSRPGYLGTPLTDVNRTIDGSADALAAQMSTLGVERYGLLCWSGGGPPAYRLALRYPRRVSAPVANAALSQRYDWQPPSEDRFLFDTAPGS